MFGGSWDKNLAFCILVFSVHLLVFKAYLELMHWQEENREKIKAAFKNPEEKE